MSWIVSVLLTVIDFRYDVVIEVICIIILVLVFFMIFSWCHSHEHFLVWTVGRVMVGTDSGAPHLALQCDTLGTKILSVPAVTTASAPSTAFVAPGSIPVSIVTESPDLQLLHLIRHHLHHGLLPPQQLINVLCDVRHELIQLGVLRLELFAIGCFDKSNETGVNGF